MSRKFGLVVLCVGVLASGCAHKETKPPAVAASVGAGSADDSNTSVSLDPQGSDGQKIEGLVTVHFAFDRASLQQSDYSLLKANAAWIRAHPELRMQIEGHCDNRGSVEYNLALGEKRAKAVQSYLINLGVPANSLTIISYGKEKPLDTADTDEAFGKNRRANFVPIK